MSSARSPRLVPLAPPTLLLVALAATAALPGAARGQPTGGKGGVFAPAESPLELTASDGSGLALVALGAEVVVDDPLAFTELRLTFSNPEERVREGRFRITLPQGAVVSRFAMRMGDRWQEGEVVERQAAREAYEDFLHRRQDPALLETEAGNEFSARVFPIPPRGQKELIISYSQELTRTAEPYRLPLRGLPKVGSLAIRALVARTPVEGGAAATSLGGRRTRNEVIEVNRTDFTPDRDFEIADRGAARHAGLRHGNLVVTRVQPLGAADKPSPIEGLFVLVDTSASRALGFADQMKRLEELLAELARAGDPAVSVAAFDQSVEPIFTGRASGFAAGGRARLLARDALGASDFEGALGWLAATLKKAPRSKRVLLVTDAVATAGETGADKLRPRVKALGAVGVERLDVLGVGGIRDDELGRRLARAGLAQDGLVLDGAAPPAELARRLGLATRSGLKVEVEGSKWVWPQVLDGVQAGDEVLLYADLPGGGPLAIKVGGHPVALGGVETAERPLLERAWVKARMSRLLEQRDAVAATDADLADALKTQVLELSIRHRVLCPLTALLVLESERDYARFHIERRALADILTVGPGGITVLQRKDTAIVVDTPPPVDVAADERPAKGAPKPAPESKRKSPFEAAKKELEKVSAGRPEPEPPAASAPAPVRVEESRVAMDKDSASEGASGRMGAGAPGGGRARENARSIGGRPSAPPPAPMASPAPAAAELAASPRMDPDALIGRPVRRPPPATRRQAEIASDMPPSVAPYTGELAEVMALLAQGKRAEALTRATSWRKRDAGDVLALVALGEALEASGDPSRAARAYGSIIDLFPSRADLRRFAGGRLERIGRAALDLAVDTFKKAVEQRPDHPSSHRMLAFALIKAGRPAEAFEALVVAVGRSYPEGRFRGVDRILREDLGLAAAAWTRADGKRAAEIRERLRRAGGLPEESASVRFVLTWETDVNDVDFHVWDGRGGHAFFSQPELPSGGSLYADVTTGYGPECFTIRHGSGGRAYPYKLRAHYYSRGPMGYGMGKLQIIDHDGKGGLRFEERPFVVMQDQAYVDLGSLGAGGGATTIAGQGR
jgi:Flp pilus assembly protein TadD